MIVKYLLSIEFLALIIKFVVFPVSVASLLVVAHIRGPKNYEPAVTDGSGLVKARVLIVDKLMDVRAKKMAFFQFMGPIIRAENYRIQILRRRIQSAQAGFGNPDWVVAVAAEYKVTWTGWEWVDLLKRVDITPLFLVLAQSANESDWGQSRFAQQGNNMFGQWCFTKGCGMVPKYRDANASHEVATYDTVNASVRAYMKNLNTSAAYDALRDMRWLARLRGVHPQAMPVSAGLAPYSERGKAYVSDIQSMIRKNRDLMIESTAGDS